MASTPPIAGVREPFIVRILSLRNIVIAIGLGCVLAGLVRGAVGFYQRWREEHLVSQAVLFMEKGDYPSAVLSARQALLSNPANLGASHVMADVADRMGVPEAVFWRGRTSDLNPGDSLAAMDWASTALRHGDIASADQGLQRVHGVARKTPEYHQLAGAMALTMKEHALAELHFSMALKLQPSNRSYQINLATVQVGSPNPETAGKARHALDQLRLDPKVRMLALRALLGDSLNRSDLKNSLKYARELKAAPEGGFRDKISLLEVLHRWNDPEFASCLEELKSRASGRPGDVYELVSWMNGHEMSGEALAWMRTLSPVVLAQQTAASVMAEAYVLQKDWKGLRSLVDTPWGDLDSVRIAYQSRASRELDNAVAANLQWRQAVRAAKNTSQRGMLLKLADSWGWRIEAEDLLWEQAKAAANPRWELLSLYRRYREQKNTPGMREVSLRIVKADPADLIALNNLATFSMLLNIERPKAYEMARALHEKDKSLPVPLTTHALALYFQGRSEEAVKLMEGLKEDQLREPSVAAYYGVFLAGAGDNEKALKFLDLAKTAPLLPEEANLVDEARRKLRSHGP